MVPRPRPGKGRRSFPRNHSWGLIGSMGFLCGAMLNLYEMLYDFVSTKTYKNRPLKEDDCVAGIIGRIAGDIDVCVFWPYEGARMGEPAQKPYGYPHTPMKCPARCANPQGFRLRQGGGCFRQDHGCSGNVRRRPRIRSFEKHWRDIK